jgi:hypothetical protein
MTAAKSLTANLNSPTDQRCTVAAFGSSPSIWLQLEANDGPLEFSKAFHLPKAKTARRNIQDVMTASETRGIHRNGESQTSLIGAQSTGNTCTFRNL